MTTQCFISICGWVAHNSCFMEQLDCIGKVKIYNASEASFDYYYNFFDSKSLLERGVKKAAQRKKERNYPLTKDQLTCTKSAKKNSIFTHPINEINKGHGTIYQKYLGHDRKRCIKGDFKFCTDKTSSLNTMSFLVFQIIQYTKVLLAYSLQERPLPP